MIVRCACGTVPSESGFQSLANLIPSSTVSSKRAVGNDNNHDYFLKMATVLILPKDVPRATESQGVKLFGKWDAEYGSRHAYR